jgi:hypothetical protein
MEEPIKYNKDTDQWIKDIVHEYISLWLSEFGIEGCIELIERFQSLSYIHYYNEDLKSRGINVKIKEKTNE